ncbi:MAG: hypothetical protein WBW51_08110 [Methyloceanibacter sp.]
MYRALDADKIIATIDLLQRRIDERFPGLDLAAVAGDLSAAAHDTAQKAKALAKPNWKLRLLLPLSFLAVCFVVVYLVLTYGPVIGALPQTPSINVEVTNLLQTLEATINTIVIAGAALIFLYTRERWFKRHEALKALHQLRSLVHVIDMHQLTKDPSLVLGHERGNDTAASPKRVMTPFELGRYLDYCSEMLSLTGKVAALYAQDLDDPVVVEAVNDIEMLATNLSRKVWQKIAILQAATLGQLQMRALTE